MECYALHFNLINSSVLLRPLSTQERRKFSLCWETAFRLLVAGRLEDYESQVAFSNDGGFCLLRMVGAELGDQVAALINIAAVLPEFVKSLARPPVLQEELTEQIAFRTGISYIADVPNGPDLRVQDINRLPLCNALKRERDWTVPKGDGTVITLWEEAYTHIKNWSRWPFIKRKARIYGESKTVWDVRLAPPGLLGEAVPEASASHLLALSNASIYWLQDTLSRTKKAAEGLVEVYEPQRYLWETVTAIKDYFVTEFGLSEESRTALFLFNEKSNSLILTSSSAEVSHTARSIDLKKRWGPQKKLSSAAEAFTLNKCVVYPDTRRSGFPVFRKEQKKTILSQISIPIALPTMSLGPKQIFPVAVENLPSKPVGVLCVDDRSSGKLPQLDDEAAALFLRMIDPLFADLRVGYLLTCFDFDSKGRSPP